MTLENEKLRYRGSKHVVIWNIYEKKIISPISFLNILLLTSLNAFVQGELTQMIWVGLSVQSFCSKENNVSAALQMAEEEFDFEWVIFKCRWRAQNSDSKTQWTHYPINVAWHMAWAPEGREEQSQAGPSWVRPWICLWVRPWDRPD